MNPQATTLVLIGMPGAGKSTVGVILAKRTTRAFLDTDVVIQTKCGRSLQDIVDRDGYRALRNIEEEVICGLTLHNHVIATGGSAVYSSAAMHHLKQSGIIVFLDVDLTTLMSRVHDYSTRGLARRPEQSIEDLFAERYQLYANYADMTISCSGMQQDQVCDEIISRVSMLKLCCQASVFP